MLAAGVWAGEEAVLADRRDRLDGALGGIVVDGGAAAVEEPGGVLRAPERAAHGPRGLRLAGQAGALVLQPWRQGIDDRPGPGVARRPPGSCPRWCCRSPAAPPATRFRMARSRSGGTDGHREVAVRVVSGRPARMHARTWTVRDGVGCSRVSDLSSRPIAPRVRMAIQEPGPRRLGELAAPNPDSGSPGPLSSTLAPRRPSPCSDRRRRPAVVAQATTVEPRRFSLFVAIVQGIRAILSASAVAARTLGFPATIGSGHGPAGGAPPDRAHGSDDRRSPDIALPHARELPELRSSARCHPLLDEAEPGGEVTGAFEALHPWREGADRLGADRPHAGHGMADRRSAAIG